jgi:hypothetical protein
MNQESDNKLEAAIRGTKVSNRTEWLILAPFLSWWYWLRGLSPCYYLVNLHLRRRAGPVLVAKA